MNIVDCWSYLSSVEVDHILDLLSDNIVDALVEAGEADAGEDVEEDDGGDHRDGGVGGRQPKTKSNVHHLLSIIVELVH